MVAGDVRAEPLALVLQLEAGDAWFQRPPCQHECPIFGIGAEHHVRLDRFVAIGTCITSVAADLRVSADVGHARCHRKIFWDSPKSGLETIKICAYRPSGV